MNIFFLPSQATRQIGLTDVLWAAWIAHIFGVPIGYGFAYLDMNIARLFVSQSPMFGGAVFLEPQGIPYIALTSLVSVPFSVALVFGCSRVGALGIGTIVLLGAAFGFLVASPWAYVFGPLFLSQASSIQAVIRMAWIGAVVGLSASCAYWFALRYRCPQAFEADHWGKTRLGLGIYTFMAAVLAALPALLISLA